MPLSGNGDRGRFEQAIIDRLEAFLLELGKGFCFVARQKRITEQGRRYADHLDPVEGGGGSRRRRTRHGIAREHQPGS